MAKPLQVFVVDDHVDLAESTGRVVRLHGHRVDVFSSAESVLKALDTVTPDLIITDIGMPQMDGCELAVRVKQRPDCERTILAALTGLGDEEDRQAAIEAGFDYRFVKPMQSDELQTFIEEIATKSATR
jgi:DNA-binding response OmpR family regulator